MPVNNDKNIDDYLLNKLSDEERMEFEKELSTNDSLRKELELRRNIIKGVQSLGRDKMKERLKKIHSEVNRPPTIRRRLWPLVSGIAATVALLVFSWSYFSDSSTLSTQDLYASNYEAYKLSLTSRDATDEETAKINTLYNKKEYQAVLPLFEKALERNPNDVRMLLGAGISLLELDEAAKARDYFKRILRLQDLRLSDTAAWYTALSYLKEGNTEQTKQALIPLMENTKADFHSKAVKLSKAIE